MEKVKGRTSPDWSTDRPVGQPTPNRPVAASASPVPANVAAAMGESQKPSRVPRRKVLAAGAGGGLGGNLAVILAYHFPVLPEIVIAAYTSLLVTVLVVATAYLVPEKD